MGERHDAGLGEYKSALDSSNDLVAILDTGCVYRMVNRAFLEAHQLEEQDVLGRSLPEVMGRQAYEVILPHLSKCLAGAEVSYTLEMSFPEKGVRTLLVNYTPVCATDGSVERILSLIRDITPLREAEAVSRRHEATYARLFQDSHAAMLLIDPVSGLIIDCNKACCTFYRRSREELSLLPVSELEAPESKGTILGWKDYPRPMLCRHLTAYGEERFVEIYVSPFTPESRQLLHLSIYDVTESRRQAERDAFLASIVDSTHDAITGKSLDGIVRSWNKGAEQIYGFSEAEALGRHISLVIPPELLDEAEMLMERVCNGERVVSHETRRLRKDGRMIDVSLIISPISDEKGGIQGISTIARDITRRKRDERRMNILAAIVEQAAEAFVILDHAGRVEHVNRAFSGLSGIAEEEARGKRLQDILQPALDAEGQQVWPEELLSSNPWTGRLALKIRDGASAVFRVRALDLTSPDGSPPGRVCILRDVRREESLEMQLRQAQKMEALGTLSSGIAHDFNNVLASIMVNAETAALLATQLPETLRDCLDDIGSSSRRGAELVRNILTFCRQGEQELRLLEMCPLVKEALKLLRSTLPKSVELSVRIEGQGAMVLADPSHIHQLVMNLSLNAVQSMPEGGVLSVSLQEGEKGGELELRIEDQGMGIPQEHIQRVCDPFFTTKPAGEGTGLGLSIVHGIVSGCGGNLDIDSVLGRGTTVTVTLPVQEGKDRAADVTNTALLPGEGSILLVDDDAGVLASLVRGLGRLGYETQAFDNAADALQNFRENKGRFDLLLCDQAMPGMAGSELGKLLREETPELPIIFYTGDSGRLDPDLLTNMAPCALLHKPVSIVVLNNTIHGLLAEGMQD